MKHGTLAFGFAAQPALQITAADTSRRVHTWVRVAARSNKKTCNR